MVREWQRATNLAPPYVGPQPPVWPQLRQLVRVTGPYLGRGNLAYGRMQQYTPGGLRDREQVVVWEPNGITLPSGAVLRGRLSGAYPLGGSAQSPLVITSLRCCGVASVSSSSASAAPTIFNICCAAFPQPRDIFATLTNAGNCPCLDGLVVPMTWFPASTEYLGSVNHTCPGTSYGVVKVLLQCTSPGPPATWVYTVVCVDFSPNQDVQPAAVTCASPGVPFFGQSSAPCRPFDNGNPVAFTCCDNHNLGNVNAAFTQ